MLTKKIVQTNVQIHSFSKGDDLKDRISLSDGICSAIPYRKSIRYSEMARVPKEPWRVPTDNEFDILLAKKLTTKYSSAVGFLRISEDLLDLFRTLNLHNAENQQLFKKLIDSQAGINAIQLAEQFVRSLLLKGDEFRTIMIYNPPNLKSTAFVPEIGQYIGLHVDYFQHQSISARDKSSNRICINLGSEARYLVFMNLTMNDLIRLLNPDPNISNDDLVLQFFSKYPEYPVVRLKIMPGEAYIAPTQNIIHDGIGAIKKPDIHLTICGHISFIALHQWSISQHK